MYLGKLMASETDRADPERMRTELEGQGLSFESQRMGIITFRHLQFGAGSFRLIEWKEDTAYIQNGEAVLQVNGVNEQIGELYIRKTGECYRSDALCPCDPLPEPLAILLPMFRKVVSVLIIEAQKKTGGGISRHLQMFDEFFSQLPTTQ